MAVDRSARSGGGCRPWRRHEGSTRRRPCPSDRQACSRCTTPSTSAPSSAARRCSTRSRWRPPPATPASPVPSRCWPTLGAARALPIEATNVVVRCRHPDRPPPRQPPPAPSTGKPLDGAVAARLNRTLSQRVVTPALLAVFPRDHTEPGHARRLRRRVRRRGGPPPTPRWLRSPRPARRGWPACSTAAMARSPGSPIARRASARSSTRCSTGRPTACSSPARRSTSPPTPDLAGLLGGGTGAGRARGERGRPRRPPARQLHDGESRDRPRPPLPRRPCSGAAGAATCDC